MTTLLLHTCCAPCTTYPEQRLRHQGFQVTGFWYNPNVHPYTEHQKRRESLEGYSALVRLPMIWWEEYEMPRFFRAVVGREADRCQLCYRLRLGKAAEVAARRGFELFSTTLLVSPYQKHELLRQVGEAVAVEQGIRFYYQDFRVGWPERGRLTREHNLYRQQYCGCVYSEWERYARVDVAQVVARYGCEVVENARA